MIKFNSLINFSFSTIKFPELYVKSFHLNKKIRSCISLYDLNQLVITHHEEIQLYGKTLILEALNEFPLNFAIRTLQSPLKVYKYALDMQNLSLYEQQIKYANICKLLEYCTKQAIFLDKAIKEQEQKILTRIKQEPFDIIDSINWILFQRNKNNAQILEHSLNIICNTSFERSGSIMSKLFNTFLKNLQWKHLRRYRKIFEYMCNSYELSIESPKIMISNFTKLVKLKLHLVGYDRIPKAVDQICSKIETQIKSLEMHHLQNAFWCFSSLPTSYNRKLFNLLFEQIVSRVDKQLFNLSVLPIRNMSKEQLERFMTAYLQRGIPINETVFYINSEESQLFFTSQVFSKAIRKQFFKPINEKRAKTDFAGYFSVGRALLDSIGQDQLQRQEIHKQLQKVYDCSFGKAGQDMTSIQTSLCGWFNLYSLELEASIFGNKRNQLRFKIFNEIKYFTNKKFSSQWKVKKYYAQIRQVLKKHGNSKLKEIQSLIIELLEKDLNSLDQIDSVAFPQYVFLLQECENNQVYKAALQRIYKKLIGEDAISMVEVYIRYPEKSSGLTTVLTSRLWSLNRTPDIPLKIIAGVPTIYCQDSVGALMDPIPSILQEAVALMNQSTLQNLSVSELTAIIKFCRYFLWSTKIFAQKLILLTISFINSQKLSQVDEANTSLLLQLFNLCVELKQDNSHSYLDKISHFLQRQVKNSYNLLQMTHFLQIKLLLKGSVPLNEPVETLVKQIIVRVKSQQNICRQSAMIILLKLHSLQHIDLSPNQLSQFKEIILKGLQGLRIYPKDIQALLGVSFIQHWDIINLSKTNELKSIIVHSLKHTNIQQIAEYYLYYIRFGHKIKCSEIIQLCLQPLALFPLDPSHIIMLSNILQFYPSMFCKTLLQRFIKDAAVNFSIFRGHILHVLYYINIMYYDLPSCYSRLFLKMMNKAEQELLADINEGDKQEKEGHLHHLLQRTYKYYWIAIKNKHITTNTIQIFKKNIQLIQNVYEILAFKSFNSISRDTIYKIHQYLFKELEKQLYKAKKKLLFSPKKNSNIRSAKQYFIYYDYMTKIEKLLKEQFRRSRQLERTLQSMNIQQQNTNQQQHAKTSFYTFNGKANDIRYQYCVRVQGKIYYIFAFGKDDKNSANLNKGIVRLNEQLYKDLLNQKTIFVEEGNIKLDFA